jgi:hypothetical protein
MDVEVTIKFVLKNFVDKDDVEDETFSLKDEVRNYLEMEGIYSALEDEDYDLIEVKMME